MKKRMMVLLVIISGLLFYQTLYAAVIPGPIGVSASDGTYTDKVRITWSAISASGLTYKVFRSDSLGGTRTQIGTTPSLSYDDTTAVAGQTYHYWIRGEYKVGIVTVVSDYSDSDSGYAGQGTGGTPGAALSVAIDTPVSAVTITQGGSVMFTSTTIGGTPSFVYWWDFKSMGGSTLEDPGNITFTVPGVYEVVLYAKDSLNVVASDTVTVTVTPGAGALSVSIDTPVSAVSITAGGSVNFGCTPSGGSPFYSFWWNFSSAGSSTAEDPGSVVFTTPGIYYVIVYAADTVGTVVSDTVTVTVTPGAGALSVVIDTPSSAVSITAGGSVNFSCTATGGTPVYSYWWNFNSTIEDPGSISFPTAGVYEVIVYVQDSLGTVAWDTVMVTVTPGAGALSVAIDTPSSSVTIQAGGSVNFSCTTTGGTPGYSYWWTINSTSEDPGSITFSAAGVYEVIVYAQDSLGTVASDTVTVTVTDPPAADLSGDWLVTVVGFSTSTWYTDVDVKSNGTFTYREYLLGMLYSSGSGTWTYNDTTKYIDMMVDGGGAFAQGVITGTTTNFTIPGYHEEVGYVTYQFTKK